MEKLNSAPIIVELPTENKAELISFKEYFNNNAYLIRQCEDEDVMFHVSFLTISQAIEKAMLFLHWKPNFDSFTEFFEDCDGLILSYQSAWLTQHAHKDWQEDSYKIAESLPPTISGRRRINEAIKLYMDQHFLMDIVLSELRQIIVFSTQERHFIIEEGIPFLKKTIRLLDLNPIQLSLIKGKA